MNGPPGLRGLNYVTAKSVDCVDPLECIQNDLIIGPIVDIKTNNLLSNYLTGNSVGCVNP